MIRKWLKNISEQRELRKVAEARRKHEKEVLHRMGWESTCECGLKHFADEAGRVFAESEVHWHTVCKCGRKGKLFLGPGVFGDGPSDLRVMEKDYRYYTMFGHPIYELVGDEVVEIGHGKFTTSKRFYDYTNDEMIAFTVKQEDQSISAKHVHYLNLGADAVNLEGPGFEQGWLKGNGYADHAVVMLTEYFRACKHQTWMDKLTKQNDTGEEHY